MARASLRRLLDQIPGCHQTKPDQWQGRCPVHKGGDEENESIGVSINPDGRILVHCFTGCSYEAITSQTAMSAADMGPDDDAPRIYNPDRPKKVPSDEWERRTVEWADNFSRSPAARAVLASALMLPESVFAEFPGLGLWNDHKDGPCWTFPERDPKGNIIGIGLRFRDHKKRAPNNSARGLSIPAGWKDKSGPLYVVEGPSDTLAMTAGNLAVIGRPSVDGGVRMLAELIRTEAPDRRIVWMGENDRKHTGEWPGRDKSKKAAQKLANELGRAIEFALPPNSMEKDMRAWLTHLVLDGVQWAEIPDRVEKFLKTTIISPSARAPSTPPAPATDGKTRGKIGLNTNNRRAVNDDVLKLLPNDANLYARGNMLVRVIQAEGKIYYRGKDKSGNPIPIMVIPPHARLSAVEPATLGERISDVADFFKLNRRGQSEEAHVPNWCIDGIHAREEWPTLKNLTALVDYPVLRPDGTIVATFGHDTHTGVFYNHTGSVCVPANPTRDHALAAWAELSEVVCDFPFEQEVHRSAWLAALLTPMTRFAFFGCVPVFLIDGNAAGAGKGLLADTIALILTGRPFATMGYVADQTEMSKRITAIAIEGEQIVLFDNIADDFGGSAIDRALTSLEWSERVLGQSKNMKCPMRIGWYGTGNNIELVGDVLRRLCQIRLESPEERPEERRNFLHQDLRAWVMVERDRLLSAAATILAAYYADGAPRVDLKHWGSFEAWSEIVRQAIVWLGLPDPFDTRDHILADTDNSKALVRSIVMNWRKIDTDGTGLTSNEIVLRIMGEDGKSTPSNLRDVRDAIVQVNPHPTGRSLGQHFKRHRTARFSGLFLVGMNVNRDGATRWIVRRSDTKEVVGGLGAGFAGFAEEGSRSGSVNGHTPSDEPDAVKTPISRPIDSANPANSASRNGKTGFSALDDE